MSKGVNIKKNNELKILISVLVLIILVTILGSTYAFFNYTRTGSTNTVSTGHISFNFNDGSDLTLGNAFPATSSDVNNVLSKTFTITAHTTLDAGIHYNVYVVYGDAVTGKTRFRDDIMTFQYVPPADGNGFTTLTNNYSSPASLTFVSGKALIASGLVRNTTASTTKTFTLNAWIDSDKMNISSTTKRATLAEGNPSLAVSTSGTTTATRYMTNDNTESSTVTLYPAITSQQGKIIYTTYEFANSYYSYKILIEAEDSTLPIAS